MRCLLLLITVVLIPACPALAQTDYSDRTNIVYIVGQVVKVQRQVITVDLGEAHTIEALDHLAVFHPVNGYFQAVGRINVEHTTSTTCACTGRLETQPGDIVITVRELYQLRRGAKHRRAILTREVIRARTQQSQSTFENITFANDLSDYGKQYWQWSQGNRAVAGAMLSSSLRGSRSDRLKLLQAQLDLMREYYRRSTIAVEAAGDGWNNVMQVVAGPTALAGHKLLREVAAEEEAELEANSQISPPELRDRVQEIMFERLPEQQNVIAMTIALLTQQDTTNIPAFLESVISRTQFPNLTDDTQLVLDIEKVLRELQAPANS